MGGGQPLFQEPHRSSKAEDGPSAPPATSPGLPCPAPCPQSASSDSMRSFSLCPFHRLGLKIVSPRPGEKGGLLLPRTAISYLRLHTLLAVKNCIQSSLEMGTRKQNPERADSMAQAHSTPVGDVQEHSHRPWNSKTERALTQTLAKSSGETSESTFQRQKGGRLEGWGRCWEFEAWLGHLLCDLRQVVCPFCDLVTPMMEILGPTNTNRNDTEAMCWHTR